MLALKIRQPVTRGSECNEKDSVVEYKNTVRTEKDKEVTTRGSKISRSRSEEGYEEVEYNVVEGEVTEKIHGSGGMLRGE